jgi:hypothetical protein
MRGHAVGLGGAVVPSPSINPGADTSDSATREDAPARTVKPTIVEGDEGPHQGKPLEVRRVRESTTISDKELVSAAAEVMSQGPAAKLCDLVHKLRIKPYYLPHDVARGVVIGARVAACDVASQKGDLQALTQSGRSVIAECLQKTLHHWGREPEFVTVPEGRSREEGDETSDSEMSVESESKGSLGDFLYTNRTDEAGEMLASDGDKKRGAAVASTSSHGADERCSTGTRKTTSRCTSVDGQMAATITIGPELLKYTV